VCGLTCGLGRGESRPRGGGNRWTDIFRSAKPKLWKTTFNNSNDFAAPLTSLPTTIRHLRMRYQAGQAVIVLISREQLGRYSRVGKYAWPGEKPFVYGATTLGIVDLSKSARDEPVMLHAENVGKPNEARYGGWGIGKAAAHPALFSRGRGEVYGRLWDLSRFRAPLVYCRWASENFS
jgi:hypothetical protein